MSEESETERWEGWDDPLAEVAQFLSAIPSRVVAEQLYGLFQNEQLVQEMLAAKLDPTDQEQCRIYLGKHSEEIASLARARLLQWCAGISSREG